MKKVHFLAIASLCAVAFGPSASCATKPTKAAPPASISMDVTDTSLQDVIKLIAAQAGCDFLIEGTVPSRRLTLSAMNVPLDDALDFISTHPADFQYRKVLLPPGSALLDSADDLAKAARQAKGITGPSMVLIDPIKKTAAVSVNESDSGPITSALKADGWVEVYLITNDSAPSSDSAKPAAPTVDDYTAKRKEVADLFLSFGPDDRRKAALFDLSLILNPSLGYGSSLLKSLSGSVDRPAESDSFPLALARYIDQRLQDQPPVDALVNTIPRDMLPEVKKELVKILTAVDARIKRKNDSPARD